MRQTHHIKDLAPTAHEYDETGFPWTVVGVFPTEAENTEWWGWFNYTVGLGLHELWLPCASIEGRAMDNQLAGGILNIIAAGWRSGQVYFGDNIIIPLGVVDGDDVDTVWWVKDTPEPARYRQANLALAEQCVPILWSSGLGWPDD